MKQKKILIFLLLITLVIISSSCSRDQETVVIKGSTTVLPIAQKATEVFYKKTKIPVSLSGTGSGDGIKSLIDGTCDIANSSREIKKEEIELASSKGIKIKEITIAYDMIVPIVHPSNKVNNLSIEQLKAIYDGSITNWKEVGGNDEKIVVISRDSSSGTFEVWESKVMNKTEVRADALLQASNGAVLTAVANNKNTIGYIGFGYLNSTVKMLWVNNIEPTIENGKSAVYPLSRKLYIYVNESKISGQTQKYVDFLLSKEGQQIVKETGFIPISK
ncbi:MAG TPA: PstS family phosphate ABC transporter substrate-binding protein [Exilispira sp.]|nr:PstS family phosphate ABC transporter substrate-binding protein [Caldisericia bacterium]HPB47653.1 PstS family phosphate ABC transporter substrate-binding protein [Exilispira sp.]